MINEKSVLSLVGRTPIVRLYEIEKYFDLSARLYASLESYNPSGSVKDRAALFMISEALESGRLREGGVVIEATSGNMGISLSMLSLVYNYRAIILMPKNMSEERIRLIKSYGGEVVLTNADRGMSGAKDRAEELAGETRAFIPSQFTNRHNLLAHYSTTGPQIFRELCGGVDIFVCGVGTGGTIGGVGRYLKEKSPSVRIFAVEPYESAVVSGRGRGSHGIQGIGAGFVPPLFDLALIDGVITPTTDEAVKYQRILLKKEGIFAGISSGASLFGAVKLAQREENKGKSIVTLFADGGERYLSVNLDKP